MSNAPRQLTEVADRTTAALEAIFAAEIATWRDLDPMIERVAQHVLQRGDHSLEQASIQLAFRVVGVKLHLFAKLRRHLTHNPAQSR